MRTGHSDRDLVRAQPGRGWADQLHRLACPSLTNAAWALIRRLAVILLGFRSLDPDRNEDIGKRVLASDARLS